MSGLVPVPTTRVSDLFATQRLVSQMQDDQLQLFNLQTQISTGKRLQLPSDDAPAALRAINLQRLLDRKGQIQTNIQSSNSYLTAAESNLSSVTDLLNELRGSVVGVTGTLSSDEDRQSVVQQIDEALKSIVAAGNSKLQGRYLFSGSRSGDQPFDFNGDYVTYSGNEGVLRSFVDLNRLFDTNLAGTGVFGGKSSQIKGTDLNPQTSADTLLSTINGGQGVSRNATISVSINTGVATKTSVIDLSRAVTLGDVAHIIEQGAPSGTEIVADVTGDGLVLSTPSGTITISEVGDGLAAHELGINTAANAAPVSTIAGSSLNAAVLKTTRLGELLGTKASGRVVSPSAENNDIVLTANKNGAEFNNVRVIFAAGGTAGAEVVTYDESNPANKTLTVQVQAGVSTATQVAAAITAEGHFTAAIDYHDASSAAQSGTNPVDVADFGQLTSAGSGTVLDSTSGLILTNAGKTITLDTSSAKTVEDLLNLMNGAGLGLSAQINAGRNGIDVQSVVSGADFAIGENGGTTAAQLGIRTYTGQTKLADFNRGLGIPINADATHDDLLVTARDGTQLSINLSTAKNVNDVIALINSNAANNTGTTKVVAQLATTGNGIELVDESTATTGSFSVQTVEGSQAAEYLGFVPKGQMQVSTNTLDGNGNFVLQSTDRHTLEADGVFNTLLRLKTALQQNDTQEIGRSLDRLDTDMSRVTFARSEIGSRLQSLQTIGDKLKDENVQLKSALSNDTDVDLVAAISEMTSRQYAFQASLRTAASVMKLSLLDFI
jgi:flagellin-like hook-associated protein FlgL